MFTCSYVAVLFKVILQGKMTLGHESLHGEYRNRLFDKHDGPFLSATERIVPHKEFSTHYKSMTERCIFYELEQTLEGLLWSTFKVVI